MERKPQDQRDFQLAVNKSQVPLRIGDKLLRTLVTFECLAALVPMVPCG